MDLGRDMETLPLAAGQTEDLEAEAEGLDATPPADAQSRLYDQLRNVRIGPARSLMGTTVLNAINRFGRGKVVLGSTLALAAVVGLATSRSSLAAKAFHGGPELQLLQDANYSTANIRPGVSLSSGLTIRNYGQDCWSACGKAGFCQEFCGAGNACCRFLQATDPIECSGVWDFGMKTEHTCVAPVNPTFWVKAYDLSVHNWGEDCLSPCEHAGYCQEFCGEGNVCCKWGDARDPAECGGIISWGSKDRHTCVKPVRPEYVVDLKSSSPSMQNWGQDCWDACGKAGLCQEFCGLGNACCLFSDGAPPPECFGVQLWGAKDRHTCVKPQNPIYEVELDAPEAKHWGEGCWGPCRNRSGFCSDFCGTGKACCRFGALDAPECAFISDWGTKDRYTCVAPVSPAYQLAAQRPNGSSVLHWAADCFDACGKLDGACPGFCGEGNACCRFGSWKDPPECLGIVEWGSKEHHTCVVPINPDVYVNHAQQDCLGPCGGNGFCEAWCGEGNACCRYGSSEDPAECQGVQFWPAHDAYTCVRARGPDLGVHNALAHARCSPGEVLSDSKECVKADHPEMMTFYMYRAAADETSLELENVNLGNMEGVLWYLQNDVLMACPRKHDITRVIRYVVSMKNTRATWEEGRKSQFGQFVFFDQGRCMYNDSRCDELWARYGHVVGCRELDTDSLDLPNYAGPPAPVLFSLPGREPDHTGRCQTPDGSPDCTWTAEYAGEVRIDELSGITNQAQFCNNGNVEYSPATDAGVGTTFWNEKRSRSRCMSRVGYLRQLFLMKYPTFPGTLGEPECDWRRDESS